MQRNQHTLNFAAFTLALLQHPTTNNNTKNNNNNQNYLKDDDRCENMNIS